MIQFSEIIAGGRPFFILKHQNENGYQLMTGEAISFNALEELPFAECQGEITGTYVCAIPFAQAHEKGYPVHSEAGLKLSCIKIDRITDIQLPDITGLGEKTTLTEAPKFHLSDDDYKQVVQSIIDDEIGNGAGANFVIPRSGTAKIANMSPHLALTIFRTLAEIEYGNYWNFIFFDGSRYLIGATPGLHIRSNDRRITMQPLSGTMRKGLDPKHFKSDVSSFLQDSKEQFELFMLLDEDLKIVTSLTDGHVNVYGPMLKELPNMIHTYYYIDGEGQRSYSEILRRSMFSPTVTGSPIDSAFRVIHAHETRDRRFYGAAIALAGQGDHGSFLDSAVLIRTLEIDVVGNLFFYTGSTIVKDSKPEQELHESSLKIENTLNVIRGTATPIRQPLQSLIAENIETIRVLQGRNATLSRYWMGKQDISAHPDLLDKGIVLVNNEDDFCFMMRTIFRSMGLKVEVIPFHAFDSSDWDGWLPILGPGPGSPIDRNNPKMAKTYAIIDKYLEDGIPFLAVCLGHQILCDRLGIPVVRKDIPYQGTQKEIDLFGKKERAGFYNTFAAYSKQDLPDLRIASDESTGEIYGLEGKTFKSFQFHPESILTQNGFDIMQDAALDLFRLMPKMAAEYRVKPAETILEVR